MTDFAILWEWLSFAARWTHVITAIAWIGSSFYFIALDLGLRKTRACRHSRMARSGRCMAAASTHPEISRGARLPPEHLTWFKWESYFTWLSGFGSLVIVYYFGADLSHRPACARRPQLGAIAISSARSWWAGMSTIGSAIADRQFDRRADGGAVRRAHRHGRGPIRWSLPAAPPCCIWAPSPPPSWLPTSP
jgi:hypothetical protein